MLSQPSGELMSRLLCSVFHHIVPKQIYVSIYNSDRADGPCSFSQESLEAFCAITGLENYLRHLIKKTKQTVKPLMNASFAC